MPPKILRFYVFHEEPKGKFIKGNIHQNSNPLLVKQCFFPILCLSVGSSRRVTPIYFALLSFHQQGWKHERQMELLIRLINVISLCPSPSSWEQACPLVIGYCCLLLVSKAHWILGFSSSPSECTLRYIARIL